MLRSLQPRPQIHFGWQEKDLAVREVQKKQEQPLSLVELREEMQKYTKNYLDFMGLGVGDVDQILCEVCGKPANDIHHITPRSLGGSDEPVNLIALCRVSNDVNEKKGCHDKAACGKLTKDFLYWIVKKRTENMTGQDRREQHNVNTI